MGVVEEEPPAGAPDWIVTFADMISLLVTFFILLLTFSSMDEHDAFQVKGNIIGTTGTLSHDNGASAVKPPPLDKMLAMDAARGAQLPHSRPTEELLNDVSDQAQKLTDEHAELDLAAMTDGVVIRYDDRGTFKPGSIEISSYLQSSLGELGRVLEHYPNVIVVEGHTDNGFKATKSYPTPESMSIARADAVAEYLLANSNMSPKQIQIAGYGAGKPAVPNDTPEGRRTNRRVELRIMSLSQDRAAALKESNG
ncbi:MAG: chemotaxis protein MotB [Candidatus Paceibacteria bacterium]|jgi:chemotaxis protein MotB